MAWKVEIDPEAEKELDRLDPQHAKRILRFLFKRIATNEDPKRFGDPLKRNFSCLWKYRVGDYRVVCDIQEQIFTVLVVMIDHRRKVYGGH